MEWFFVWNGSSWTWNGSSWTEVNELNTARGYLGGANAGSQTAAMAFGGGSPYKNNTEKWDGTNWTWNGSAWTETNNMNTARGGGSGVGQVYTAALAVGGYTNQNSVEEWDGSSWTEVGNTNVAKYGTRGMGSTTAGLIFGGATVTPSTLGETESWNGSAWTWNGSSWTEVGI